MAKLDRALMAGHQEFALYLLFCFQQGQLVHVCGHISLWICHDLLGAPLGSL